MIRHNIPMGTLHKDTEFDITAAYAIESAIFAGWTEVTSDEVEALLDSGNVDELFAKRDEAIAWLNANACEDNVYFEYWETVEDVMLS